MARRAASRVAPFALIALLTPATVPAQTMSADVLALHRSVFHVDPARGWEPDIVESQKLGLWYIEGPIASRNLTIGCALLQIGWHTAMFRNQPNDPIARNAEQLKNEECSRLGDGWAVASRWMSCPPFVDGGPHVLILELGFSMEVGYEGIW